MPAGWFPLRRESLIVVFHNRNDDSKINNQIRKQNEYSIRERINHDNHTRIEDFVSQWNCHWNYKKTFVPISRDLHSCESWVLEILKWSKRSCISTIVIMIHRWKRTTKISNINITSPSYGQGYKTYHSLIRNDKLISCFEYLSFDKML